MALSSSEIKKIQEQLKELANAMDKASAQAKAMSIIQEGESKALNATSNSVADLTNRYLKLAEARERVYSSFSKPIVMGQGTALPPGNVPLALPERASTSNVINATGRQYPYSSQIVNDSYFNRIYSYERRNKIPYTPPAAGYVGGLKPPQPAGDINDVLREMAGKGQAAEEPAFTFEGLKESTRYAEEAIKKVQQYGMSLKDLKRVRVDASTGMEQYVFRQVQENGAIREAIVYVDKYGRALTDTQKRFRTFGSALMRNIGEVAKWTVAVQLIYGPMRKFQELMDTMVRNEAKLADITIATGQAQGQVNRIFETAARVASETGESIDGVLEGYELAYRAAGKIQDPIERNITAQQLLKDSMMLSKIAGMEQAKALDVLVGALAQAGDQLGETNNKLLEGQRLLDKWVAVSKVANVSVDTLAESFAITAASAEGAGLSIDELNGLIAVIAENTTLSATESGNAARAFISGFQSDNATKVLTQFGIATKDVEGNMRNFYDVMVDVRALFDQGLISEEELNKIATAVGGSGARRGAQVAATIKNIERISTVAAVSEKAQGDAADALDIKLGTVQTSLKELGNSFQELAQILGTDGGLLDLFKGTLSVFNGLFEQTNDLARALGTALPILVAFGAALQQMESSGGALSKWWDNKRLGISGMGIFSNNRGARDFIVKDHRFTQSILGAGAVFGMASVNAKQGNMGAAGGNLIGGVLGGIVGALTPLGPGIGAAIGSAAGGAFTKEVLQAEGSFEDLFARVFPDPTKAAEEAGLTDAEKQQKAIEDAILGSKSGWEKAGIWVMQGAFNAWKAGANLFREGNQQYGSMNMSQAALVWDEIFGGGEVVKQVAEYTAIWNKNQEGVNQSLSNSTRIGREANQTALQYKEELGGISQELLNQAQQQAIVGDITAKQLQTIKDSYSGLDLQISSFYTAFGSELLKTNKGLEDSSDAFKFFGELIAYGSQEDIDYLRGLVTTIVTLDEAMQDLADSGKSTIEYNGMDMTIQQLEEEKRKTQEVAAATAQLINTQQRLSRFQAPSFINMEGFSRGDAEKVLETAESYMRDRWQAMWDEGITNLSFEEWRSTFGDVMIELGKEAGYLFAENMDSSLISKAQKDLEEAGGLLSSALTSNLSLRGFEDLSMSELQSLAAQSLAINERLKAQYGDRGYKGETETFLGVAKDGITGPITAELTILQMLMRDLIDVNEEQVEGIYNLPSNASFYVPFEGYAMGFTGGGGGGSWTNPFDNLLDTGQGNNNEVPEVTLSSNTYKEWWQHAKDYGAMPYQQQGYTPPQVVTTPATKAEPNIYTPIRTGGEDNRSWFEKFFSVETFETAKSLQGGAGNPFSTFMNNYFWAGLENVFRDELKFAQFDTKPSKGTEQAGLLEMFELASNKPINTDFTLNIQSQTQLYLDGQQIYESLSSVMQSELIRQEGNSSVTRTVVI